jgi:hypothetical protein
MSITQTIEQHITGRPAIRVPGETILRLFKHNFGCKNLFRRWSSESSRNGNRSQDKGKHKQKDEEQISEDEGGSEPSNLTEPPSEGGELSEPSSSASAAARWAGYFGHGILLGGVRGILSYYGARGIMSDMVFLGFTSSVDRCPLWAEMANNFPL